MSKREKIQNQLFEHRLLILHWPRRPGSAPGTGIGGRRPNKRHLALASEQVEAALRAYRPTGRVQELHVRGSERDERR
jgi:hypothetical protein